VRIDSLQKHPRLNSPIHLIQSRERELARVYVYVHDHIAYFVISLQILRTDVASIFGENAVDLAQHAGHVFVNMQEAMFAGERRERHFREVY